MIPSQRGFRVARGCFRGSAGKAGNLRRISARFLLSASLALGNLFSPCSPLRAEEPAEGSPPLSVPEDLRLDPAGRDMAKALGLYYKGLMLEAALKIPEQIQCYQEVLRLDPANATLAMETANLCAAYGRFDEARKLLEENLALNPELARAHVNLSQFCETYANGNEAIEARALAVAEEASRVFPHDANVCAHLTGMLLGHGRTEDAREAFERTLALTEASADARFWLQMAGLARRVLSHERDRVNGLYDNALARAGDDLEIAKTVGDYFSTSRQYQKACEVYEAIIAAHPDALEVRERLVHVLRTLGEKERALETLEALVAIDPVNEETRQLLAELYQAEGDTVKAVAEYEQILRLKDGGIEDYAQLADQMIEADLLEGAERLLVRARLRFPDSPVLTRGLAYVLSCLERPDDALAWYDKTAELAEHFGDDSLSSDFYHEYGAAADAAKQHDRAADYFRKAIDLVRDSEDETGAAKSLNYLGYMWLEQNINLDAAGQLIERAIALEPDAPEYIDSLGWYYFRRGQFDKALDALLKAEKLLEEPDPVVLDHIAQTYHELGKNEDAVRYLTRALEIKPGNPEVEARLKVIEAQSSSAPVSVPPAAADTSTPKKEKAA